MNRIDISTGMAFDKFREAFAPLRALVYADDESNAVFSMDQPGLAFASLGNAEITRVGQDLDHKVANLLRVIGVDAGQAFGA